MKVEYRPVKFVEEEETSEGWRLDLLKKEYYLKVLQTLLPRNSVLQILKPKLIRKIRGPISAPATASDTLEGINGIIHLLRDAGFFAEVFDAKKLLDCRQY